MSTISLRAIKNNKKLKGTEISLREAIASFCSTYTPYTDKNLKTIAERIDMDPGQASTAIQGLEDKKEVCRKDGRIYLLVLDDYQLEKIAAENFPLLEKLAELGSLEAKEMVEKTTIKIEESSIEVQFLLHFFMFSQLRDSQFKLRDSQSPVENFTSLNEKVSIALKEKNVLRNVSLNDSTNEEEEEKTPSSSSSRANGQSFQSGGDKDEPRNENRSTKKQKTEVPRGGEGKNGNPDKNSGAEFVDETRPELTDEQFLEYLAKRPENQGIDVQGLYLEMVKWCKKNRGNQPSRKRFLKWLLVERKSVPMSLEIPEENPKGGNKPSGNGKRKDSGMSDEEWYEQNAHLVPQQ